MSLLNPWTASWEKVNAVQNRRVVIYFTNPTFGAFHKPSNAASLGQYIKDKDKNLLYLSDV